jgi:hypothetical protein
VKTITRKEILARSRAGALTVLLVLPACGKSGPGQPSQTPDNTPGVRVNVLVLGTRVYPTSQFHAAPPDRCDAQHWHASGTVYSIGTAGALESVVCHDNYQFQPLSDPDPGSCGFGRVSDVLRTEMTVSAACWASWLAKP